MELKIHVLLRTKFKQRFFTIWKRKVSEVGKGGVRDKVDKETKLKSSLTLYVWNLLANLKILSFVFGKTKKGGHSHYLALPCPFFFPSFFSFAFYHFTTSLCNGLLMVIWKLLWLWQDCDIILLWLLRIIVQFCKFI